MGVTYESICEKLGFDVLSYEPELSGYEDDSKISPFHILTLEEKLFLNEYLMTHIKKDN